MATELTPDEMSFFESGGQLPDALAAEHQAALDNTTAEAAAAEAARTQAESDAAAAAISAKAAPEAPAGDAALLARLEQEATARSALEASIQEIKDQLAAALKAPAAPAAEIPDQNTDPLGHMMHQLKTVNETVVKLQTDLTAQQQLNIQRQQFEAFHTGIKAQQAAFEATTPDFKDAYAHIRTLRTEDLRLAGAPEKDIAKILVQDELQIAQTAIARGKNPAEEMYAMAKRYGYVPKATPAAAAAAQTPEQKIAALAKGVDAARQPNKGAPAAGIELTSAGLKDLSNDDLNKLVADPKAWAKIVGGSDINDIFG